MKRRLLFRSIALSAAVLLLSGALRAQDRTPQIETQQNTAAQAGPQVEINTASGAVTDPNLGEIGLVNRREKPKMFTFSTTQSLNYTNNAFLTRNNLQGAYFWNGRFDASFVPYATRAFTPRLTLEQSFFRYDRFSRLDFDSQTARLDLKYSLTRDDSWFFNGAYSYNRLYSHRDDLGDFYHFGLLDASLTHLMRLSALPLNLVTTGGVYWRQGDPSEFDRISFYGNASVAYDLMEKVQLSAFTRPEFQVYNNDGRTDFNLLIGASATWTPVEYVSLAASAVYVGNFSTNSARRYDLLNPALILGARIAF